MFKRKIYTLLKERKENKDRLPLIIKGLRQIGKTTIVKQFAVNNYDNVFLLDFRDINSLSSVFEGDFDIDGILLKLSPLKSRLAIKDGSDFIAKKTLFIFDEVQDCPNARSSLKYFSLDGRFDVICTGSLLGINGYRLNGQESRGIGVGFEEQLEMKPMDFEEFLWAKGISDEIIQILKKCVDENKQIDNYYHQLFLNIVREYICVGGMPKAVDEFLKTNDLEKVRKIQRNLISTFKSDFGVHLDNNFKLLVNENEKAKILDVFDSIPKQLAKENKKFQYSYVRKNGSARTYFNALKWLKDYGLIDFCYNLNSLEEPLNVFAIEDQFKIYFSDIGLLTATLDLSSQYKIINNDLNVGKGMIYESLVAEAFIKNQKPLYYFSKSSGLEIDFVCILESEIYLIEAKERNGNSKSFKTVLENKNYKVKSLIKLTSQNVGKINNIKTIPYYMTFYVCGK